MVAHVFGALSCRRRILMSPAVVFTSKKDAILGTVNFGHAHPGFGCAERSCAEEMAANLCVRHHATMKGHKGAALVVRFNKTGEFCVSGGKDRTVQLWNPHRGGRIKEYSGGHGYEVRDVRVSNDNACIVSCGGDRDIFLWDVGSGRVIRRFRGHNQRVNTLFFNEDCSVLVSGSYDSTMAFWDLRSRMRDPIQVVREFKDSVSSLVVRGAEVIAASVDGCLRYFDLRMGRVFVDHICQPISCVRLSNDGNCALLNCLDSTVRLMDRSSGELLQEFRGHVHKAFVVEGCVSIDDATVISGSEDGLLVHWDLVEARVLARVHAHTRTVSSVDAHPSEPCLVSASVDGDLKVWKTKP